MGKEQAEGGIFKPEVGNMEDVDNMKEEGRSTQCFKTIGVKRR